MPTFHEQTHSYPNVISLRADPTATNFYAFDMNFFANSSRNYTAGRRRAERTFSFFMYKSIRPQSLLSYSCGRLSRTFFAVFIIVPVHCKSCDQLWSGRCGRLVLVMVHNKPRPGIHRPNLSSLFDVPRWGLVYWEVALYNIIRPRVFFLFIISRRLRDAIA